VAVLQEHDVADVLPVGGPLAPLLLFFLIQGR
jgi:hypothetical protein